jgi:transposase-like protein
MKLTIRTVTDRCRTESDAWEFLEELRWHGRPVCPHCGVIDGHYFLNARNGGRKTRTGKVSERRVWKCHACRRQFTATTNTVMHGSKVEIRTWLLVLVQVSASRNGISAREVERMHGVTAETAWHLLHRIREAMKRDPLVGKLSGEVMVDESWIGGAPKNRHKAERQPRRRGSGPWTDKTPVVALVSAATGEVRTRVVPKVNGETLREVLRSETDAPNTVLVTDESNAYTRLGFHFAAHRTVNHAQDVYVADGYSTNAVESYFAQMKRSLDGTHHNVSIQHLPRYLAEWDFRASTRNLSDTERMERIIDGAAGRRLPYRPTAAA